MSIASTINKILDTHSLLPEDLALLLNLPVSTVYSWIKSVHTPSIYNALCVAKLFHNFELEIIEQMLKKHFDIRQSRTKAYGKYALEEFSPLEEYKIIINTGVTWAIDSKRGEFYDISIMKYFISIEDKLKSFNYSNLTISDPSEVNNLIILQEPQLVVLETWHEIINEIALRNRSMHNLTWMQFEDLMGQLLEHFGWKVSDIKRTKDKGIDLIATQLILPDITFNMLVQCKKFTPENKVGLSIVKEVWSTKWDHGFNKAMIATSSSFTKGAIDFADKWNMDIRDHDQIIDWCLKYGKHNI